MSKRKKTGIILLSLTLALGAYLGSVYLLQEHWRKISIGRDTTYLTAPLHPDGTVDYVAAINAQFSQGVTPENNAAIPLLQVLDLPKLLVPPRDALFFQRLGQKPISEPENYFVNFETFMATRLGIPEKSITNTQREKWWEQLELREYSPWQEKQNPEVAAWLKQNEKPLRLVLEASHREHYFIPLVETPGHETMIDSGPMFIGYYKSLANTLNTRGMLHLGSGDFPGYQDDLLAAARLGYLLSQSHSNIDRMIATVIWLKTFRNVLPALQENRLTPSQAQELLKNLRALPPMPGVTTTLNSSRLGALDYLTQFARFGPDMGHPPVSSSNESNESQTGPPIRQSFGIRFTAINFNDLLRELNTQWDLEIQAAQINSYARRNNALEKLHRDRAAKLQKDQASWNPLRRAFGSLMDTSQNNKFYAYQDEARMRLHLVELGLLLELYHAAHHQYPESLANLPADQLQGADEDFFSGKKMIYRRQSTGYILYSVGLNAQDDGGIDYPTSNKAKRPPNGPPNPDDLVIQVPSP